MLYWVLHSTAVYITLASIFVFVQTQVICGSTPFTQWGKALLLQKPIPEFDSLIPWFIVYIPSSRYSRLIDIENKFVELRAQQTLAIKLVLS